MTIVPFSSVIYIDMANTSISSAHRKKSVKKVSAKSHSEWWKDDMTLIILGGGALLMLLYIAVLK